MSNISWAVSSNVSLLAAFPASGSLTARSSSDYNHPLAAWAMELSYAAYNLITDQFIPGIPSGFMQEPYDDATKTAKAELERNGFADATKFNYSDPDNVAAHTIGHRRVVEESEQSAPESINNLNGGNNYGTVLGENNVFFCGAASDFCGLCSDTDKAVLGVSGSILGYDMELDNRSVIELSSDSLGDGNTRELVVVVIRGSVTMEDWFMDFGSQVGFDLDRFNGGKDMVLQSLLHGMGNAANCTVCSGNAAQGSSKILII